MYVGVGVCMYRYVCEYVCPVCMYGWIYVTMYVNMFSLFNIADIIVHMSSIAPVSLFKFTGDNSMKIKKKCQLTLSTVD